MPDPLDYENKVEFMKVCVPQAIGEGREHDQAVAMCSSMWENRNKSGNCLKAVSQTEDELRVANYIVLFGGRDLEGIASKRVNKDGSKGQYFTADTDFESQYTKTGQLYVDWEHGREGEIDPDAPKKSDVLGFVDWATAKKDAIGLWVERVLDRRNKYMKYLETLIREGLIGNSIETTNNFNVAPNGQITKAPLERDTLTVNPMEPRMMTRNVVTALKSLALDHPELKALLPKEVGETSENAATVEPATTNPQFKKTLETIKMANIELTQDEYKDLLKGQIQSKPTEAPPPPPEDPAMKAMSDRLDKLTELIKNAPNLKDAGYVAPDSEEDHAESKSLGDFLVAVKNGNTTRLTKVYHAERDTDNDTKGMTKTDLAEGAGATGGYLVPVQYAPAIVAAGAPYSILRRAGATVIQMSGKTLQVPTLDIETAPSAGDTSYAGGAIAYWTEEATAPTESEPRFRLVELVNHKLATYAQASNELRADSAVESILTTVLGRASASKENYAFFRGDGVGKPLGIMESGALLTSTRSAAHAFALADVADMFGQLLPDSYTKGIWVMNPTVIDPLIQLVSAPLAWMPDLNTAIPGLRLLGLPVYVTGALCAVGTTGDVLLIDPSYYIIGDRAGLSIAYSEHYAFTSDQGTWRLTSRVAGQPWIENYITLEDAATTVSPFVALSTST